MEELLEQANEVQESLSRSYAVPDEIDDLELEAGAHPSLLALSSFLAND
jgi:charged multivesicular body protein 5